MILGACSLCGGTVEVPDAWYGMDPPRPTCRRCHATKKLAVIEMDEPRASYIPKELNTLWDEASKKKAFENYCDATRLDTPILDDAEYLDKVGNG